MPGGSQKWGKKKKRETKCQVSQMPGLNVTETGRGELGVLGTEFSSLSAPFLSFR